MKKLLIIMLSVLLFTCSKEQGNINEIPFSQRNNLPIVTFDINGNYVKLLVDTGSTLNILDSSLKSKLKFTTKPSDITFEGIGGNKRAEVVENALVKYKDSIVFIKFTTFDLSNVSKSIGVKGVIGSEFLEDNGYVVDFVNNKLKR